MRQTPLTFAARKFRGDEFAARPRPRRGYSAGRVAATPRRGSSAETGDGPPRHGVADRPSSAREKNLGATSAGNPAATPARVLLPRALFRQRGCHPAALERATHRGRTREPQNRLRHSSAAAPPGPAAAATPRTRPPQPQPTVRAEAKRQPCRRSSIRRSCRPWPARRPSSARFPGPQDTSRRTRTSCCVLAADAASGPTPQKSSKTDSVSSNQGRRRPRDDGGVHAGRPGPPGDARRV